MNFPQRAGRDLSRATPSLRHAQRAKPRNVRNPAGLHLSFAGNCSNKRNQLSLTEDFGQATFDIVMINNVAHHFTPAQNVELAKRVARALAPSGLYSFG